MNENLAKEAATFTETTFIEDLETIVKISDTLFLTVPDDLITTVWNQMKDMSLEGKFICHCSGALSAGDAFPGIDKCGACLLYTSVWIDKNCRKSYNNSK